MTKRTYIEIQIPFAGFYDSKWSGMIDQAETQEIEYTAEYRQEEDGIAKDLRLDEKELFDIYNRYSDYSAAYRDIAKDYVEQFNVELTERLGFDLGLKFADMTSPRYYNFETDRLFANIPVSMVRKLVTMAKRSPEAFGKVIKSRHTSYAGFWSHYTNNLQEWLDKSWRDYDHNELMTVLLTVLNEEDEDLKDIEWSIYESLAEHDYEYWSNCVDWPKVEADIDELRAEKLAEMQEENPDYIPPYRCNETLDLFAK